MVMEALPFRLLKSTQTPEGGQIQSESPACVIVTGQLTRDAKFTVS